MIKSKKKNLWCFLFAFVALVFSAMFAVSISPKANAAPENITLTFSKLAGCQDGDLSRYVIDFATDKSDLGDEFWNDNTATLVDSDGNAKEISGSGLNYSGSGSELTLYLKYEHFVAGATTAAEIGEHAFYLPAGTKIGGVSNLSNDIALRINRSAVSNLEVKSLALNGGGAQDNFNRFLVRFKGGKADGNVSLGTINVLIDGTLQKVDFCDLGGGDFGALLDYSVCGKNQNHTLKFLLGSVTGGDYFFKNDLTVYIKNNEITDREASDKTVIGYTSTTAQSDRYVLFFDGVGNGGYSGIGKVSVLINGEEKFLDFINWGNETALLLPFDVCPNDASKLNEITIKSCTIGGFVIKNDINLWISGYKYLTEAPKTVTLTRDGGDYQGGNLNRYVVYFNEIAGGDLAYLGKLSVIVDDKTEKEEAFYQWNNGKSALLLDAENYPLKTEFKITTKTGWLGNYFIADSVTFYIYNEQIIDKMPVTISCGNDVKSEDIVWSEVALTGMFSAKNIEKNGVKVIGYRYENALYESLSAVYGAIGETAPKSVSIDVVTVTIENVYGASIRLASDYQGLRFTVSISTEKAGEITDYGVFATSEAFLKKLGGDFTAIEDGKNGYKISSADEDFKTITEGDSEIYSVVIDVSPANYNKNFVACGYLTVTYAGGTAKTVLAAYSSEANLRSSYEVATKALNNSSEYNERQLKIIREYVDGVLDIDENYNLVGAERSYTIEKIADGQVKIVGKDGFDVASVKAFSIKGVRYSATFDNGTVTFDSKLLAAGQTATAGAFDGAASYLGDGIANDCGWGCSRTVSKKRAISR